MPLLRDVVTAVGIDLEGHGGHSGSMDEGRAIHVGLHVRICRPRRLWGRAALASYREEPLSEGRPAVCATLPRTPATGSVQQRDSTPNQPKSAVCSAVIWTRGARRNSWMRCAPPDCRRESHASCVELPDLASVSTIVRSVSHSVRRTTASVSANVRRKSVLIARRAVHHCASPQLGPRP